jgi:hypothetical protein
LNKNNRRLPLANGGCFMVNYIYVMGI